MSKYIAITIGDINGIGIKILIDLFNRNKVNNFILFSNVNIIKRYIKKNKLKLRLNLLNKNAKNLNLKKNYLNLFSYETKSLEENTYKSLRFAYEFCKKKICIGIITLPLRKDLIRKNINKNFIGHTEYFQKIDKKESVNMILFHKKIIISPITTHIEIRKIPKFISNKKYLYNQIYNLNNTLKIDFNILKPKLIISGLNPHAGEYGEIGKEEKKFIIPVINKLNKKGINIIGPVSADSILINQNFKNIDCFVFIFHDQALIPFKLISQFSGVNYTGNLNIIRTSPDHGTAYNLVNSKNFSNKSFLNCFKLVNKIYKNRKFNDKS